MYKVRAYIRITQSFKPPRHFSILIKLSREISGCGAYLDQRRLHKLLEEAAPEAPHDYGEVRAPKRQEQQSEQRLARLIKDGQWRTAEREKVHRCV